MILKKLVKKKKKKSLNKKKLSYWSVFIGTTHRIHEMGPYVPTDKGLLMACDSWTSRTRRRGHQRSLGVKITHCIPPSGAGREWDKHLPHLHLKMSESRRKRGSLNNEVTSHSDEAKQQPVQKVCFTMTTNHGYILNFSVAFTKKKFHSKWLEL